MKTDPDQLPDENDERLLEQAMQRVGREAHQQFMDLATRNLSVDVVHALERRRQRFALFTRISLAAVATGTAVVLFMISAPEPVPVTPLSSSTVVADVTDTDASVMAAEYLADASVEQALDRIIDVSVADPVILTDDDINALIEGL